MIFLKIIYRFLILLYNVENFIKIVDLKDNYHIFKNNRIFISSRKNKKIYKVILFKTITVT